MKMKVTSGRVMHSPLSFAFSMKELGGSYIQKYNAITGEYSPDRTLTPYRLQPQLNITDPDKLIPDGDYATSMTNAVWTVTLYRDGKAQSLTKGTSMTTGDYYVDTYHALTIRRNIATNELMRVSFEGDYYNSIRDETSHFSWSRDLTTQEQTDTNITLECRFPSKFNFSPFKEYGQLPIEAVLHNGETELTPEQSVFKWQVFNGTGWVDIVPEENLWYVGGMNTGTITIDVDYLQKEILRVTAYAKANPEQQVSASTLLRRWYGQWEDNYNFAYAQFVTEKTRKTKVIAQITNRQGNIQNPTQFFDVEMFYRDNATAPWTCLGTGVEFDIERDQISGDHQVGGVARELSAYRPIVLPDGSLLADSDGKLIVGRFPTSKVETE